MPVKPENLFTKNRKKHITLYPNGEKIEVKRYKSDLQKIREAQEVEKHHLFGHAATA